MELTPGISKVDDKDPYKHDCSPASSPVVFEVPRVGADNPRDDEVAYGHAHAAADENRPSAEIINPKDGRNGKDELEYPRDSCG